MRKQISARTGSGSMMRLRGTLLRARLDWARTWLGRLGYRASRFRFIPPHLHLADSSVAADFLAGQIVLAGRSLLAGGRSVFDFTPPSTAFSIALHGFEWLRHFDASGAGEVRAGAQDLVRQWIERREAGAIPGFEAPEAIPRRVIAWITHSALLTEGADFTHYKRILRNLARDASMLRVLADRQSLGVLRLECAIALLFHALALDRGKGAVNEAEKLFIAAFAGCIAQDGAPRNRDAGTAVRIAADLIPLLALYRARQKAAPERLAPGLLSMIAFIRMMQHPDGGLALFNNAGLVTRDIVAQVTRFGAGHVTRLVSAPETGFERLEDEYGIVIADAGRLPPPAFDAEAGASALAFEFSTKSDRIIVNCGTPPSAEGETATSFRSGPAHSTVLIDDTSLGVLAPGPSLLGPQVHRLVSGDEGAMPRRDQGGSGLVLSHGGFRDRTGLDVERHLTLLPEGGGLEGRDRIIDRDGRNENRRATLAFHLHPRILPVPLSRQDAIVLRLPHQAPGRDMWLFEAPGIALHLEASRCFEQDSASPKTEVIIVDVPITGTSDIRWRLVPYRG